MTKKQRHCEICQETVLKKKCISIFQCDQHTFCQNCCNKMFMSAIQRFIQFVCPTCHAKIDEQSIFFKNKSPLQRRNYKRNRLFNKEILCPSQECQAYLKLNQSTLQCKQCQTVFCKYCLKLFHPIQKCQQYHQKLIYLQKFEYKCCPNCNFVLQKAQGCNHMKCLCTKQFCYECLQSWTSTHQCYKKEERVRRNNRPQSYCWINIVLIIIVFIALSIVFEIIQLYFNGYFQKQNIKQMPTFNNKQNIFNDL